MSCPTKFGDMLVFSFPDFHLLLSSTGTLQNLSACFRVLQGQSGQKFHRAYPAIRRPQDAGAICALPSHAYPIQHQKAFHTKGSRTHMKRVRPFEGQIDARSFFDGLPLEHVPELRHRSLPAGAPACGGYPWGESLFERAIKLVASDVPCQHDLQLLVEVACKETQRNESGFRAALKWFPALKVGI
jgi:hypothetical protein